MDDIYVYLRDDMPPGQSEYVTPCLGGYTIYINAKLNHEEQQKAYDHALQHIKNGDFDADQTAGVQEIEAAAHGMTDLPFAREAYRAKIKKERRSIQAKLRRASARNKARSAKDLFALCEEQYLDPDRRQ